MTTFDVHPWMEHDKTGHRAQLPDIPYWRNAGWNPCDGPPPETDLTRDHPQTEPTAEATTRTLGRKPKMTEE